MKVTMRIPTQVYGYLEVEGEPTDLPAMEKLHQDYAEQKLTFKKGEFVELETFTNEKIRYNDETHEYTDLAGNPLVSGSKYAASKEKPFPKEMILPKVAAKLGVEAGLIDAMWNGNGKLSRDFGSAVHLAMENWFRYQEHGTEYHIPKHPFLKNLVESYPKKAALILPEVLISSVKNRMVGRIDGIEIIDMVAKKCNIIDFKSDAEVKKNLPKHAVQLSFYARILEKKGWTVEHLYIENYTDGWETHEVAKVPIT